MTGTERSICATMCRSTADFGAERRDHRDTAAEIAHDQRRQEIGTIEAAQPFDNRPIIGRLSRIRRLEPGRRSNGGLLHVAAMRSARNAYAAPTVSVPDRVELQDIAHSVPKNVRIAC